jgi:Rod binding domain-containing protein
MRGNGLDEAAAIAGGQGKGSEQELREKFSQFVGETFFGQMLKSMRATVGKPAYFHGGRAEEAFQGQLDQTLSQHMTKASASRFADPMFERQFPHLAGNRTESFEQLAQLPRR